jgi:hypothetical protein
MDRKLPVQQAAGVPRTVRARVFAIFIVLPTACTLGQWHSTSAERPSSRLELASRNLTVRYEGNHPGLDQALSRALASEGFTVVSHPPYHEDLELTLSVVREHDTAIAVASLRSDGFFVAEVRAPDQDDETAAAALARNLARSQGTADFIRNSGTPEQTNSGPQ